MAAAIEASNLTKAYELGGRQTDVVTRVSLGIERGELVAIEGKRSSGKSTLLHIMGGLQPPDSGQVFLEGLDLTQLDEEQLSQVRIDRVGFLYEAFNLLLDETVLTNVEVPLQTMGMDPTDSRIKAQDALQVVGLGYQIEHVVGKLSTGFRQLVALARALVNNPSIILADEPTRDLDNDSKDQVMGIFQKINEAGMTIVLSTDDSRTTSYCSRVVKMNKGSARDEGVNRRQRIVPSEKVRGMRYIRVDLEEDQVVCPRCNYSNYEGGEVCESCNFPLHLSQEEQQSIQGRLGGADRRLMGVENAADDDEAVDDDLTAELKQIPFLAGLGASNLVKVIPTLEELSYPKCSTIIKQGNEGDFFYILRSGSVEVWLEREGRDDVFIAELGATDCFGEMALLTDQPRSASIDSITDVEVFRIGKAEFRKLLEENVSLPIYFNRMMAQRARELQEQAKS